MDQRWRELVAAGRRYGLRIQFSEARELLVNDCSDAVFRADLGGANLSSADLGLASVSGANLFAATLSSSDLNGADLSGAA